MNASDLIAELALATKEQMAVVVAPLLERIAVLEAKQAVPLDLDLVAVKAAQLVPAPKDGAPGRDGHDAAPLDFEPWRDRLAAAERANEALFAAHMKKESVIEGLQAEVVALKAWQARPDDIEAKVGAAVALAIKSLPTPKDGMPGRDGKDGRDVDAALLETIVAASVERVLAEWPKPKDGASLTVEDVAPLIKSEVSSAVAALPKAKDGRGIGDLFVERDGELSVTFTDGGRVKVGNIIGPPGKDGINGERGKDGADGLGFDDLQGEFDEAKGWVLRFARGEQVKEFAAPVPRDGGVYRPGTLYLKGQYVTAQGSLWLALTDTRDRPGDGSKSWRLIVKRGRDGRDLRADS